MAEIQQVREEKQKREQNINIPFPGLGRSGTRVIGQVVARAGTVFFTTPAGWVMIGVTIVFITTFVIVLSIGGGGISPSLSPTPEIATPTPAP